MHMKKIIKTILPVVIVLLISLLTVRPLSLPGFFPMHDNTQVERVYEMSKAVSDGMFPVRWVQDLGYGYGYPIFNFYAPLAYYEGAKLVLLGLSALTATKLMIGVGMLIAGVGMYLLVSSLFGSLSGILGGLLYQFGLYHAVDLYVRGDVSELWAYGIFPFLLWGIYNIAFKQRKVFWMGMTSVFFAALIASHNLSAFMVTPFVFVTIIFLSILDKSWKTLLYGISALLLGVGLAASYALPVFFEMKYTNVLSQIAGSNNFRDHFVCLPQLWSSPWGFGGSVPGCVDGLSFAIGKIHIVLLVGATIGAIILFKKAKARTTVILFNIVLAFLGVFLTLQISQPIWESVPSFAFLQYPWRFLFVILAYGSLSGGAAVWLIEQMVAAPYKKIMGGVFVLLSVIAILILYGKYFTPRTLYPLNSEYFTNTAHITFNVSKISDEYMPKGFIKPKKATDVPNVIVLPHKNIAVKVITNKTQEKLLLITATKSTLISIAVAPFPAWEFLLNKKIIKANETNSGYQLWVSQGVTMLDIRFVQTPIERLGNAISVASAIIIFLAIMGGIYTWYGKKNS